MQVQQWLVTSSRVSTSQGKYVLLNKNTFHCFVLIKNHSNSFQLSSLSQDTNHMKALKLPFLLKNIQRS